MPEQIFVKLGMYIMTREAISAAQLKKIPPINYTSITASNISET
jgi:uncharacterized protein YneF (UPF0154 family)